MPGNVDCMRRIGLTGAAAVAVLGMALAGCTSGGPLATRPAAHGASASATGAAAAPSAKPTPAGPVVTITPGNGTRRRRPVEGHHGHRVGRHAQERQRAHRGRSRHRQLFGREHELAQHVGAQRVAVLHGDRDRGREQREHGDEDSRVPHVVAGFDVHDRDPRGIRPELRRRDADHLVLQPADHEQGRGRARAADQHLQAGDRLLVLGLSLQHGRHLRLLPAPRLLAGRHDGELHRAPQRGRGRARRLRAPHADADVRHRPVGDRGR